MRRQIKFWFFMMLSTSFLLMGCGGGSSSTKQTVSGVAAAGAPLMGYAYLKDSSGVVKGPVLFGSDGSFSFDTTGLTPPFYLEAMGTAGGEGFNIFSAITSAAGTANINPLTNIAVAAAAGGSDPAIAYNSPSQYPITEANLSAAIANIRAMLKPLLDAFDANIDPITGSYMTNHTGLDAVFDVVSVNLDSASGEITVIDKTTGNQIAAATTTTLANPSQSVAAGDVPSQQTLTDLQAIAARLSAFATVLNNKGTGITTTDLDPFFASNFGVSDGKDRDQTISDLAGGLTEMANLRSSPFLSGITDLTLKEKIGADYRIGYVIHFSDGIAMTAEAIMTSEGGSWKVKGNGMFSALWPMAVSIHLIKSDGSDSFISGFIFYPEDYGNVLSRLVITGPGFPIGGIRFSKDPYSIISLSLDTAFRSTSAGEFSEDSDMYVIDDQTISTIPDNAEYTVICYNKDGAIVETRKYTLVKRPFLLSELDDTLFPTLGNTTSHLLSSIPNGGSFTFSYSMPTAYQPVAFEVKLSIGDSSNYDELFVRPPLTATSTSITIGSLSWTPSRGDLKLRATDAFSRTLWLEWIFK